MSHWTTKYKNLLPNEAFLILAKGGKKDATGRLKPRSLRHLPVKSHLGKVDLPHVRSAIARAPRVKGVPEKVKKAAQASARKLLAVEKAVREEQATRAGVKKSKRPPAARGRGGKVMVTPPASARRIAAEALEVRASLPPSRRGGLSPTEAGRQGVGSGVRRAQDIAAGRQVDARQVHGFCSRFAGKEREAKARGLSLADSKARQAWALWGGDPMCKAAARAVR